MTLSDFRPRWRVGLHLPCRTPVALPLVVDVLRRADGHALSVSPCVQCGRIRAALRMASSEAIVLQGFTHLCACSYALRRASPCADRLPRTYPDSGIAGVRRRAGCQQRSTAGPPMPGATARGKGGGQDKRSRHVVARKSSLHVGAARHALVAAPCRVDRQCLVGIEPSACLARLAATALDGGSA